MVVDIVVVVVVLVSVVLVSVALVSVVLVLVVLVLVVLVLMVMVEEVEGGAGGGRVVAMVLFFVLGGDSVDKSGLGRLCKTYLVFCFFENCARSPHLLLAPRLSAGCRVFLSFFC